MAPPSPTAESDIPPDLIAVYIDAARRCPTLPWTLLAGIAKLDSDHGRVNGTILDPTGSATPPLVWPAIGHDDADSGPPGGAATTNTYLGPLRFSPAAWQQLSADGNDDGVADPQNIHDATAALAQQICTADPGEDLEAAAARHLRTPEEASQAAAWSRRYAGVVSQASLGRYALPIPTGAIDSTDRLTQPHHDYPAVDIGLPVGTPVYAITSGRVIAATAASGRCGGTIVLAGDDNATYTYCHLSRIDIAIDAHVVAGAPLALSGGQPGAPGAGSSTGPHLHLSISADGNARCPQELLAAIRESRRLAPRQLPASGCVT